MEITVVRAEGGNRHRGVLARDDGTAVTFPVYDYGPVLPHDLVHHVVEQVAGLSWGFWGLTAAGARFEALARANARDPRSIEVGGDPLIAAHLDELMLAENLVAAFGSPRKQALIDEHLTLDQQDRIERGIAELNARWQATPAGGRLRLSWS